jgi:hypothetical protein
MTLLASGFNQATSSAARCRVAGTLLSLGVVSAIAPFRPSSLRQKLLNGSGIGGWLLGEELMPGLGTSTGRLLANRCRYSALVKSLVQKPDWGSQSLYFQRVPTRRSIAILNRSARRQSILRREVEFPVQVEVLQASRATCGR